MPRRQSRRALLRASGIILASGLAGCEIRRRESGGTAEPTDESTPGSDGRETVSPGTTYRFFVENSIDPSHLEEAEGISPSASATVGLEAQRNPESGEREQLFAREVDLGTGRTRQFEDAFTTDPEGPEYVVRAQLQSFEEYRPRHMSGTAAHRFVPGGFQAPTADVFRVTVASIPTADAAFTPAISMEIGTES